MIITQDTVWDSNQITDQIIQVAPGATLTIGPGAVISSKNIEVFGTLRVAGTVNDPVRLNKVTMYYGGTTTPRQTARIEISHATLNGGGLLPAGMSGYGSLSLTDSQLVGLNNLVYLWYPTADVNIERNIIRNSAGFSVGVDFNHIVAIRNNVFVDQTTSYAVESWATYGDSKLFVQYNSFLSTDKVALSLAHGYTSAAMMADHNWFGSTDLAVINAMVLDRNDDMNRASVIQLDPILTGPAANTPDLLSATPIFNRNVGGYTEYMVATPYKGPVAYVQWQQLGDDLSEVLGGSSENDFINLLGGNDAANGWGGDDVLDGGLGSNFLNGGSGNDVFFVDGRGGGVTWSTITDLEKGEWATAWGWKEGTSKLTWADMRGAEGYKGATAYIDLDANGTIDMSMTFTGKSVGSVVSMAGQVGSDTYLAFTMV